MFSIGLQRNPRYLLAVATGSAGIEENCAGVVFVADMLRRTGARRLLFDMMALTLDFGPAGGLEVISTLYNNLPPMEKIAVLVPRGMSRGIVMEVARHRDVPAQEFDDAASADVWLCI